jgi:hypothetical protein
MDNLVRIATALILLGLITACGGGDATDTPTASPTEESSPGTDAGEPTATPEPSDTPAPTATPKVTETLAPSSTPATIDTPAIMDTPVPPEPVQPTVEPPPTIAPEATQPPRPTPGSVPTAVPPELAAYLQNLQSAYAGFPQAVGALNGLLQNPAPNDGAWVGAMEDQIFNFKGLYETIRDLSPPEGLEGTHAAIANALGTCNGVADVALQGFRNQDPGLLTETGNLAKACADQLRQALGLLGEFGVQFEVPAIQVPQNP